jgi:type I restriction enzyme M protein
MQPHLDKANEIKSGVVTLKEKLKALKKANAKVEVIRDLEEKIKAQEKAAREEEVIASIIDSKVFDLKAVNPNAVLETDNRSVEEVILNIETQGKIVEEAMRNLRMLLNG